MVFEQIDFNAAIQSLEAMGVYEVIFPFILVFTIIFGVLQKVKLFGQGSQTRNFNVVIAFVTAFFVLRVPWIVETMNQFLPRISFLVVVLLMFLLVLGIFGTSPDGWTGVPFFVALVVALGGVVWAVADSLPGTSTSWLDWLPTLTASDKGILLAVGIFILILFMFKEKKPDKPTTMQWLKDEFGPDKFGRRGGSS